jgi:hypothetical protein
MDSRQRVRIEELLAERATQRLDPAAERELAVLLAAQSGALADDAFDLAAAAIDLALLGELDEMPADVRERLSARGRAWAETMRRDPR